MQAAVMDPSSLNSQLAIQVGPARFFDVATTNLAMMTLMGRLEVFTLWSTVLIAIGLKVTGKLTTQKTVVAGIIVWLIGALVPVLGALRAR